MKNSTADHLGGSRPEGGGLCGVKEKPSVTSSGHVLASLAEGVTTHRIITHHDARGSVGELFDSRWGWSEFPLVSSTFVTIHPGKIKGWAMHEVMEDRFCLLLGKAEFVFYDDREESPTRGQVSKLVLSEHDRQIVRVPTRLWHAVHNIGTSDVVIVNFPTQPYQYEEPDKYRLPVDTDLIPHRFEDRKGF